MWVGLARGSRETAERRGWERADDERDDEEDGEEDEDMGGMDDDEEDMEGFEGARFDEVRWCMVASRWAMSFLREEDWEFATTRAVRRWLSCALSLSCEAWREEREEEEEEEEAWKAAASLVASKVACWAERRSEEITERRYACSSPRVGSEDAWEARVENGSSIGEGWVPH